MYHNQQSEVYNLLASFLSSDPPVAWGQMEASRAVPLRKHLEHTGFHPILYPFYQE